MLSEREPRKINVLRRREPREGNMLREREPREGNEKGCVEGEKAKGRNYGENVFRNREPRK